MPKQRILVLTSPITGHLNPGTLYMEEIIRQYDQCEFRVIPKGIETQEDVCWADVITGHPRRSSLKKAVNLKWLHVQSAGVNGYEDKSLFGNPDIVVTRTANVFGITMAEHAIGMMLALTRDMPRYVRDAIDHRWMRVEALYEVFGSTVLLLGTGNIAGEMVKRLKGFGCAIAGLRRDISKPAPGYDNIYPACALREALSQADYVINVLPLTPATQGLLGEDEFSVMKERAIFINMGRGATVDTPALVDALQNKRIFGAGMDVIDPEPLPEDSPLWDMPNVLITPHSSGSSMQTQLRRVKLFTDLLDRYLHGETLDCQVDFGAGY